MKIANKIKTYKELSSLKCHFCNKRLLKRSRPFDFKSVLFLSDFSPAHLECHIANQIRNPGARIETLGPEYERSESDVRVRESALKEMLRHSFEKSPFEVFGVLARRDYEICDVVRTYYQKKAYSFAILEEQRKEVLSFMAEHGYDSIFHSHLFSPIFSSGNETIFLMNGFRIGIVVGSCYRKLLYCNRKVRNLLGIYEKPLGKKEGLKKFISEFRLSDATAYILEEGKVKRARIKVV